MNKNNRVCNKNLIGTPFGNYWNIQLNDPAPKFLEILPKSIYEDFYDFSWTNLRQSLLELCLIFPNLPEYVILEIFNWLPERSKIDHSLKINLIKSVRKSLINHNLIKYD